MEFQKIIEKINSQVLNSEPINGKLKVVLEGYPVVVIDGTSGVNKIVLQDVEADCEIYIDKKTIEKMRTGKLSPMMAIIRRKIKIKGDVSLALQIKNFFK
ncbi:MAG: SCP2 sterol-binding domain-containing protein [Flavobacteriaceae bacterium]|nr:SCP2 sterol-binding domain-containing protein [Flavobacteriaceae bacterium]